MDYVCNRCLFSIPSKVEMAEEQEYLRWLLRFSITRGLLLSPSPIMAPGTYGVTNFSSAHFQKILSKS